MSDKDTIISAEIAEEQFELFTDFYQIALTDLDDGDGEVVSTMIKNRFLRALRAGRLEVKETEDGLVVEQNLVVKAAGGNLDKITYRQLNGAARKSLRKVKGNYDQMYTLLARLSGESVAVYDKMSGKDLAAAEALAMLFLIA
jgi:hypothetical protein